MGRVCGSVVRAVPEAPIDPERVTLGSLASSINSTEGFARRVLTCASAAPPPQRAWDVETQQVSGTVPALARTRKGWDSPKPACARHGSSMSTAPCPDPLPPVPDTAPRHSSARADGM